jgi:peptidoglycan/xylan/chitin deacetylase (PgdA/CDA1 family)
MRIRGLGRIRKVAEAAKRRLSAGVPVLLYHRVTRLPFDPQWLAVRPERFEQQMRILREQFSPISVRELLGYLDKGDLPRNAVVVTFDDGYADNLHEAKPILEKFDIPAMVFVATGNLGGKTEFWWDELEKCLFTPVSLPERLVLRMNGESFEWRLAGRAGNPKSEIRNPKQIQTEPIGENEENGIGELSPGMGDTRNSATRVVSPAVPHSWTVLEDGNPTERHRLYREISARMKELLPAERDAVLRSIVEWSGCDGAPRPSHVSMTAGEVRELAKDGLIEIGAHTVRHPKLSRQSPEEQAYEINESRRVLRDMVGREIEHFAYPHGGTEDYTAQTIAAVKQAGFRCGYSAMPACVRRGSDRFQLPRFFVRDWEGEEFTRQLELFTRQ